MPQSFDYLIIGAGIAGLSMADALSTRDLKICVADKSAVAEGASGTPGGLVNPATGRRATKVWKAEECYRAIKKNLEKITRYSGEEFYRHNGILRPALTEKMNRKMKQQYEETEWPEGWCKWLDEREIKEMHPGIQCTGGGLWLPMGLTVDSARYLSCLADFLGDQGVEIITKVEQLPELEPDGWNLELDGRSVKAGELICATGWETSSIPYWKELPLHPVKGQLARFKAPGKQVSFDYSISSLGYIARLGQTGEFIQGSTYEHDFSHTGPDQYGEEYLRKRLRRTLPQLEQSSELIGRWAGVRASTPDYKPILGRHLEYDNLHVFTGLGSKGLMYGKFLAEHYADHLTGATPLCSTVDSERFG